MRTVLLLVVSLFAVACVLVVTPDTFGDRCRFEGEASQCGQCVAARCRAEIDACCRDASCDGAMRALDACAEKHDARCAELTGGDHDLGRCVARACNAVCAPLEGVSRTTCREPRLGEGSTCVCEVGAQTGNDFVCSERAFPETLCCAPKGWPAAGLVCTCKPLSCSPTNDGCFCALADFTPERRECAGATCCVDRDKCTCRGRACLGTFERQVPSCEVREVACADGQDRVESCSVRINE